MATKNSPKSARQQKTEDQHEVLLQEEKILWKQDLVVAGLDEAGAGPLAGPVVSACVVLNPANLVPLVGVNDSKQLSHKRRSQFADLIREHALGFALSEGSLEEIETINIRNSALHAMLRSLKDVQRTIPKIGHLLVDAREVPETTIPQSNLIKGDARSLSIAAASILAKVHRDEIMVTAAEKYPGYGFEKHKGYGTKAHIEAIRKLGPCPLHRRGFEPIRSMLEQRSLL